MSNQRDERGHFSDLEEINTRIEVSNFGPIKSGSVDLRPLTIFIGPGNTGKTFFAILIYALHRVLSGFSRLPSLNMRYTIYKNSDRLMDEFRDFITMLSKDEARLYYSDLPLMIRDLMGGFFSDPKQLQTALEVELRNCFDVDSGESLVSAFNNEIGAKIVAASSDDGNEIWNSTVSISKSGNIKAEGYIKDQELLNTDNRFLHSKSLENIQSSMEISDKLESREVSDFMTELMDEVSPFPKDVFYLPAARSGIMQSHRDIASAVMAHSTRSRLDSLGATLAFPAMTADFLSHLIAYDSGELDERRQARERRRPYLAGFSVGKRHRRPSDSIVQVAEELEESMLEGKVCSEISEHGGYPKFYFRPDGMRDDIEMNRVSSMVSELSPLVLFIRGNVCVGDTLIVEEPEAHLHPAAQTRIAVVLAKLVRLGVRVVVTTHSDWLLKQIGNLMREGDLADKAGNFQNSYPDALRTRDVGAWHFRKGGPQQGSTVSEIKFDSIDGIEPSDYEDLAEGLFNRSASLKDQNDKLTNSEFGK